jgi:hypothetical protein
LGWGLRKNFLDLIYWFKFPRTCKIAKPYLPPFWEKSKGLGRREKNNAKYYGHYVYACTPLRPIFLIHNSSDGDDGHCKCMEEPGYTAVCQEEPVKLDGVLAGLVKHFYLIKK